MNTNIDLYRPTQSYLSFVNATWINPHPSKADTPVATGGIVLNAEYWQETPVHDAYGPPFEITYVSSKKKEMVIGGRMNIIPVCITPQFSIVRVKGVDNSVFLRDPVYVRADQLPAGISVFSAIAFFFVIAEDPQLTPIVTVFKSHLSASIKSAFSNHANRVARIANALVGKPIGVQALPCVLRAGKPRAVGKSQQGYVVDPILELPNFANKEALLNALVPPETYKTLAGMAGNPDVLGYPFTDTSMPRTVAKSLPDAVALLALSRNSEAKAKPSNIIDCRALPPGEGVEYDPSEAPF